MDKDLQELKDAIEQRKDTLDLTPIDKPQTKIESLTAETAFSRAIDSAKIKTVEEASANDTQFLEDFKNKLKEATLKAAELEKQKQELDSQYLELQQNYIKTKTELEKYQQRENAWTDKEKARQYHYNGLKDIMEFMQIKNPMWIPLMYFLAVIISPIYLVWTLLISPVLTLIAGKDSERPRIVKGGIWTLALVFSVILIVFFVYAVGKFCFGWF